MAPGHSTRKTPSPPRGCQAPGLGHAVRGMNAVLFFSAEIQAAFMYAICVCLKNYKQTAFCKGNLILAQTWEFFLEEPRRNFSMKQRSLWKEGRPSPAQLLGQVSVLGCADRGSPLQAPGAASPLPPPPTPHGLRTARLGHQLSGSSSWALPGSSPSFSLPFHQSWGGDPSPGCYLKASSQGNPQLT